MASASGAGTLVVIHPFGGAGGSERVLVELSKRLHDDFEIVVILMEHGPLEDRFRDQNVEVIVEPLPGKLRIPLYPSAARRLAERLRGRDVAVVHANGTKAALLGAALAPRLDASLLWMKHGHDFNWLAPRLIGPRCDHVACVSEAVARSFPEKMQDRVSVVYPGVETPGAPEVAATDPLVLSVGTLIPTKGHDTLIQAIAELRDRGIDARMEIAGGDHRVAPGYGSALRQLVKDLGVSDRVTFLGLVSGMGPVYVRARVVALASRSRRAGVPAEGAPLALLEAMASAKAVVAGAGGGVDEIVGDGGTLVKDPSPRAFADALQPYLVDHRTASTAGVRGRARIRGQFTTEAMVAALRERYVMLGARLR